MKYRVNPYKVDDKIPDSFFMKRKYYSNAAEDFISEMSKVTHVLRQEKKNRIIYIQSEKVYKFLQSNFDFFGEFITHSKRKNNERIIVDSLYLKKI